MCYAAETRVDREVRDRGRPEVRRRLSLAFGLRWPQQCVAVEGAAVDSDDDDDGYNEHNDHTGHYNIFASKAGCRFVAQELRSSPNRPKQLACESECEVTAA